MMQMLDRYNTHTGIIINNERMLNAWIERRDRSGNNAGGITLLKKENSNGHFEFLSRQEMGRHMRDNGS
jgi:hypothetical protein